MKKSHVPRRRLAPALVLVLALCGHAAAKLPMDGLRDNPVVGDTITYLDNRGGGGSAWTAATAEMTIPATVPGDLLSDLHAANRRWVSLSSWSFRSQPTKPLPALLPVGAG